MFLRKKTEKQQQGKYLNTFLSVVECLSTVHKDLGSLLTNESYEDILKEKPPLKTTKMYISKLELAIF